MSLNAKGTEMDTVDALKAEVARCHERLGITHCSELVGGKFVRREIPMASRANWPDRIFAQEAHIQCLENDIDALVEKSDRLFDAAKAVALSMRKARHGTLVDSAAAVALAELVLEIGSGDEDDDESTP